MLGGHDWNTGKRYKCKGAGFGTTSCLDMKYVLRHIALKDHYLRHTSITFSRTYIIFGFLITVVIVGISTHVCRHSPAVRVRTFGFALCPSLGMALSSRESRTNCIRHIQLTHSANKPFSKLSRTSRTGWTWLSCHTFLHVFKGLQTTITTPSMTAQTIQDITDSIFDQSKGGGGQHLCMNSLGQLSRHLERGRVVAETLGVSEASGGQR